jgi:hypothetical protein
MVNYAARTPAGEGDDTFAVRRAARSTPHTADDDAIRGPIGIGIGWVRTSSPELVG